MKMPFCFAQHSLMMSRASSQQPLRAPSFPLSPHKRFSTVSSANSVLGFLADSKYAMPYMSYNPSRAEPLPPATMHNIYDRVGGPVDDDDYLHEPEARNMQLDDTSWRGVVNVTGALRSWNFHQSTPAYLTPAFSSKSWSLWPLGLYYFSPGTP